MTLKVFYHYIIHLKENTQCTKIFSVSFVFITVLVLYVYACTFKEVSCYNIQLYMVCWSIQLLIRWFVFSAFSNVHILPLISWTLLSFSTVENNNPCQVMFTEL